MQQIEQEEKKQEEEQEYGLNPTIIKNYSQNKIMMIKDFSFIQQNLDEETFYIQKIYQLSYLSSIDILSKTYKTLIKNTKQNVQLRYFKQIPSDKYYLKRILIDIKFNKFFQHENIIKIQDLQLPLYPQINCHMYYVSGIMDTDLCQIIKSQQNLTDEHFQFFMYQILRALYYIHSSKTIYCDLKPINVLIDANCDLKLSNFGYCRSFKNSQLGLVDNYSRSYKAPETLIDEQISHKSDIWSAGCILAELHNRRTLFLGHTDSLVYQQQISFCGTPTEEDIKLFKDESFISFIKHNPQSNKLTLSDKFTNANPLALDLLEKMLQFNPQKRPSAFECLSHQYFTGLFELEDETICQEEFDQSFYQKLDQSLEQIQDQLYKESLYFKSKYNNL